MKRAVKVEDQHIRKYEELHPELKGTPYTHILDIMLRKLLSLELVSVELETPHVKGEPDSSAPEKKLS